MSASPTLVTAAHFEYLSARTRPEDAFLIELKRAAEAAGIPPIWISAAQASFLQILLKASGARRVLEVGTLAGYSAIALARALPSASAGGKLVTIELEPKHARFAREWSARSDVADRVEVLEGAASDVLARLEGQTFDAMFIDADKSGYAGYLRAGQRLVRRGGLILVDNAFAFGELLDERSRDREVLAVRAFNDQMAATRGLHGIILPIGDGLWVAVKEGDGVKVRAGAEATDRGAQVSLSPTLAERHGKPERVPR